MGMRDTGGEVSVGKAIGAQVSQETGGKGDKLKSEREPDNILPPSDKATTQNVTEGIHRKSYSEAMIEGVRKRARVFVGDSIVRKTERVLNKGDDMVVCFPGAKIEATTERVENIEGSGKDLSTTPTSPSDKGVNVVTVGITVGALVGLVILGIAIGGTIYCLIKKSRNREAKREDQNAPVTYIREEQNANRTSETSNVYFSLQFDNPDFDGGDLTNDHYEVLGNTPVSHEQ
ncbi:hypothetical protein LSAT2_031675 [Lamellibrachia satsuma]|nr:hypothetical protein LSAT2_031675 [Lamellibrachia satsuma]